MNKEQLIARAQELQIEVPDGATNEQISNLIKIAEHSVLSNELGIAKKELEKQKELTGKAEQERDANAEKLAIANNEIISLKEALEKNSAIPSSEKGAIYQNDEGTYELTVKSFRFRQEKYNAVDAVENSELMESLIKANPVFLKKIENGN